jgi:hypothetical protein
MSESIDSGIDSRNVVPPNLSDTQRRLRPSNTAASGRLSTIPIRLTGSAIETYLRRTPLSRLFGDSSIS